MKFLSKIKEAFSIVRNLHAFINDVIVYNRKVLMVDLLYKQTTNKGISNNLFKTNLGGASFCNRVSYVVWKTGTSMLSHDRKHYAEYNSSQSYYFMVGRR